MHIYVYVYVYIICTYIRSRTCIIRICSKNFEYVKVGVMVKE